MASPAIIVDEANNAGHAGIKEALYSARNPMKPDRLYPLSHAPIHFHFRQTPADFVVTEIPLYDFSGEGEHLILKVRKKALTTWQMLETLSSHLGIRVRDIGYAGLKDRDAMTVQYISLPFKSLRTFDLTESGSSSAYFSI